jgi:hypothetical protein
MWVLLMNPNTQKDTYRWILNITIWKYSIEIGLIDKALNNANFSYIIEISRSLMN